MPAQYKVFPSQVPSAAKPDIPPNFSYVNRPLPPPTKSANGLTPQQRTHTIRRKPVRPPISALPDPPPSIPAFPPTPKTPFTLLRAEGPLDSDRVFCKFCSGNIFLGDPCFKHLCGRHLHIPCYNAYYRQLRLNGGGQPKCPGCDRAFDVDVKPWPEVDESKPKPTVVRRKSTLKRAMSATKKMLKRALSSGDTGDRPARKKVKGKEAVQPKAKSPDGPPQPNPWNTAMRHPLLRGVTAPGRLNEKPLPPIPSGKPTRIPHPPRGLSAPDRLQDKPLPPTPLTAAVLPKANKETFTFRDGAWVRERPEVERISRGDYKELHCW
ncbi:MAG: hypothetical protein Q9160_001762 [Pyrenula sp. 1 TL-2023]